MQDLAALSAPFPSSAIRWNVGSMNREKTEGTALPNIDPRAIENRLDEVVGPAGWEVEFSETVGGDHLVAVRCAISLHVDGRRVTKEDGAQADLVRGDDVSGKGHELSVKGAYTNAFKRAASKWGIGRYLYAYQALWVPLDLQGRFKETPVLPASMLPEGDTPVRAEPSKAESQAAATPATERAQAPAAADTTAAEPEVPAANDGTAAAGEEAPLSKFAMDLIGRITKVDVQTFKQYLNSPKCRAKLSDAEYAHILSKVPAAAQAA